MRHVVRFGRLEALWLRPLTFGLVVLVLMGVPFRMARAADSGLKIMILEEGSERKGATTEGKGFPTLPQGARPPFGGGSGSLLDLPAVQEVEPNNSSGTATPLAGSTVVVQGTIFPNGDIDFFSFSGSAGDRVYAATMTSFSANGSTDSQLDVMDTDGTTSLEFDDDNGSMGGLSSSIGGVVLPANGTYFLRVRHFSATSQLRPYFLYLRVQSGSPVPETEPNDTLPGQPLPASGWVSGSTSSTADVDLYSLTLGAGDTVFLSLDLDPERDTVEWNGQVGLGLFNGFFLVVNDAGAAGPDSEAFFLTVKDAGTYTVLVNVPTGGSTFGTYHLSVSVYPAAQPGASCTTYNSTDVPQTIPTGPGLVSSTITVPGNPRIADLDVAIELSHTFMPDLDVHLRSPAGNDNGLFSDIGASSQQVMNLVLDDEAGSPPLFTVVSGMVFQPELAYRLAWFDGEEAGGVWTLDIRDDAGGDGGTLTAWSLTICEPPPPPACPPGTALVTAFSSDFEADDGGFTHSGTQDEWERGLPTFSVLTTCNSGTNCWVTDLDNTYNASSSQDLLSPSIDLTSLVAPVTVSWAQRYQLESASFDHFSVDVQEAGGANPTRLFEWLDATMTDTVGSPSVTIQESAGWGVFERDASAYAGLNTELRFHLDSDSSIQFPGVAIDDVTVTACRVLVADLSVTKTDGVATAVPGGSVVYTIVASNAGPDPAPATVTDTFPGTLTCTWTCTGSGGGTCTAGPVAGNISDSASLPVGATATYTAACSIDPAATGSLVNTATVTSLVSDPNNSDNSATDTDTLVPTADLGITKTDGQTTASPGQALVYTLVASNAGLSNAPGSSVSDTFPAALNGVSWTCVGSGGGTCTAGPVAGNIADSVNLPAGSSVTYTVNATIDGAFTGLLSNTGTVAPSGSVTDPNAANNSATDTTDVLGGAVVTGTKAVSGQFVEGGAILYTVVLTNNGLGNQGDNPGDEFVDVLPPEVTLIAASASSGTVFADLGTNTLTWNGALAAGGGSVTLLIDAVINGGTGGSTISNQGTISYDSDGDGTNDALGVTDDPDTGGADDPTDFVAAEGEVILEIPTAGPVGLLLLAILLSLAALYGLRRRRSTAG